MPAASEVLAKFAAELDLLDIPAEVAGRARDCIIDTVAAATFGSQFPWSRMVLEYARRYGSGGVCSLIGSADERLHAPCAALANGVFAQAFEQDSVSHPTHGVHPGATLLPAILATCEEVKADGRAALVAFVAGAEVMFRIGAAARHSPEKVGFHQPGLVGSYGAAIASGRIMGLSCEQLVHALGIAGSLSSGILAFGKSKQGAMVKRLHVGRSAESGILAARLAGAGYTGPETVLDGKFGFLEAYCGKGDSDPALLTADLGKTWKTLCICIKRYACEKYSHPPVQAVRELMEAHAFTGADVVHLEIAGCERLLSHHNIREPTDIMKAQYSVPFTTALALIRDPNDPRSFDDSALRDPAIQAACSKIDITLLTPPGPSELAVRVTALLKDGRKLVHECTSFKGMPDDPLNEAELKHKFMLLTADLGEARADRLFGRLKRIEKEPIFSLND